MNKTFTPAPTRFCPWSMQAAPNPRIDVFEPLTVIAVLGSPADDFHTVTYAKIVAKWGLGDSAVTHAPLSTPPTPRSDPGPHTTGTTSGLPPDLTTVFLRHPGTWAATAYVAALAVA